MKNIESKGIYEKPTVEQMFKAARMYRLIAQTEARDKRGESRWRSSNKDKRVQVFLPRSLFGLMLKEDTFRYSEHRFTGRVAYRGLQRWSMRIAERYHIRTDDEQAQVNGTQDDGYRTVYRFEWNNTKVLVAEKHTRALRRPGDIDEYTPLPPTIVPANRAGISQLHRAAGEYNALEYIRTDIVNREMKHIVHEYERVSQGDCDRLISDLQSFREAGNQST